MKRETAKAIENFGDLASIMEAAKVAVSGGVLAVRPPGSFTCAEYAAHHGMVKSSAAAELQRLAKRGDYETLIAYHPDARGRITPTNFYRPKK